MRFASIIGTSRLSRTVRVVGLAISALGLAGGAYAASLWTVGLASGSSGAAQAAPAPSSITVVGAACTATCASAYPGGTGDAVVLVTNTNAYPVTVTQLILPQLTGAAEYAQGYTALSGTTFSGPVSGCSSSTTTNSSGVSWVGQSVSGTVTETLTTPVNLAASSSVTIDLAGKATMASTAPAACEALYLQMPSFAGVTATEVGGTTPTPTNTVDGW